jgi:hypothetical protein
VAERAFGKVCKHTFQTLPAVLLFVPLIGFSTALHESIQESSLPQNAGGNRSGQVVDAIPDDVVDRQGATCPLPLKTNDAVYWQDVVRTLENGRVRIRLLDSSLLNIGARSSMRIVQHDPQSQQTQLELSFGTLRGEIKKLSKSGGHFEIQTPTAVIGVVGTVFDVDASETTTHIHVLEGKVRVRNRDPKLRRQVIVHEGGETHVAHNAPPAKPIHAPAFQKERKEASEHRKVEQRELKQQRSEEKKKQREQKQQQLREQKQKQKEQKLQRRERNQKQRMSEKTAQQVQRQEQRAQRQQRNELSKRGDAQRDK